MKKQKLLLAMVVVGMLLLGSGVAMAADAKLPSADGKAVYEYITQTSPYQKWPLWPGTDTFYKGQHPHGALLTTYVTPPTEAAINAKAGQLPDGSIVVKENYMPNKMLGAVTVMYRVKGYDPDAGDWFWAKYKANGEIEAQGKVAGCIGCHTAAIQNDWVFTSPVK
ncbi:MAG: cytochrome P460 family protein [Desulfuromonadales bacterium]|nr:cytochrome P460 family protein [Desulfuromonadales bacterium]